MDMNSVRRVTYDTNMKYESHISRLTLLISTNSKLTYMSHMSHTHMKYDSKLISDLIRVRDIYMSLEFVDMSSVRRVAYVSHTHEI